MGKPHKITEIKKFRVSFNISRASNILKDALYDTGAIIAEKTLYPSFRADTEIWYTLKITDQKRDSFGGIVKLFVPKSVGALVDSSHLEDIAQEVVINRIKALKLNSDYVESTML